MKLRERMFRIGIDPFGNVVDEAHIDPVVLIEQKCIQIDLGVARERLEHAFSGVQRYGPVVAPSICSLTRKRGCPAGRGQARPAAGEEAVVCVAVVKDSTPPEASNIDYKAAVVGDTVSQRDVPQGVRHESALRTGERCERFARPV